MCGRYGFVPGENFYPRYKIENKLERLKPSYNVAPGYMMPVVFRQSETRAELMKWGLIPFWAKDPRIGYKMINARSEGIEGKPAFRSPFKSKRCLVPASGFFEWKKTDKEKIPFYIRRKDGEMFSFAGLYDTWKDAEGVELKSYTIITTQPNKLVGEIHNRMPVILEKQNEGTWVNPEISDPEKLLPLLSAIDENVLEAYPVSKKVNNPENDSEDVIGRVSEKKQEKLF